jgi:hypothetical protein
MCATELASARPQNHLISCRLGIIETQLADHLPRKRYTNLNSPNATPVPGYYEVISQSPANHRGLMTTKLPRWFDSRREGLSLVSGFPYRYKMEAIA